MKARPIKERFEETLYQSLDGCWYWLGIINRTGYGVMSIGKHKKVLAHRTSYQIYKGSPDGLCVLHVCDNPPCVNPDHLFLGTLKDNSQDMLRKGRFYDHKGSLNCRAKFTDIDVIVIREAHREGFSRKGIASYFRCNIHTLDAVIYRHSWKHI